MNTFAQHVADFIEGQGHKAEPHTEDGSSYTSLWFRTRGLNFAILVDEDDRSFLKLSCSHSLPECVIADAVAMDILLRAQDRIKCVKFSALNDKRRLLCHVELLLPDGVGLEAVFWRAVGMVEKAAREVHEELRSIAPAKSAAEKFISQFTTGRAA